MDSTPGSKMDLYARAAATLYGIISFDNFCKILDVYYGEGTLSRKRIMAYFWTSDNDDPIYYIQDELIVHASIFPDEITRRGLPFGRECYLDLITIACEMEPEIRRWEGLGYTGNEVG